MAALLPHKQIDITEKGDYEIAGISTEGTANRGESYYLVLKDDDGLANMEIERIPFTIDLVVCSA